MAIKRFMLPAVLLLAGCLRPTPTREAWTNDTSIEFPRFFEQPAVEAAADGGMVELGGNVLRALDVAAADFLGPQDANTPCVDRRESHRYRVMQQQGILFIRIDEDPRACGLSAPALDSGAQYAVGSDGRILRRLRDGEPDGSRVPTDAGPGIPVPTSEVGRSFDPPDGSVPLPFIQSHE
ncbi:hypothetical protein D7W79_33335 [Corallococcus exercitus]|uniref:Lipoprotein n=1 Tax=Corallococcus exercitus TaxID=2316736 RepID=A0A3A8HP54_9BACT|nr:hypothetical protein [Corallococcus exercitus]NOK33849.1 hypothetical protein [Corallococcus exercitus]RKG69170.1 hypothetical protein D7W79_33335 [Corallococcus exercitus]